jgi:hypothetical protein
VGVEGLPVGVEGRFKVAVEGLPPAGADCRVGVDGRGYFDDEVDDDLVGVEGLTE